MPSKRYRKPDCLQDIIDNVARIERHIEDMDRNGLEGDELRHDAVEPCPERVCEAAFRLGEQAEILLPAQPRADIRGMGNWLPHADNQIDARVIWNVVSEDLPGLEADAAATRFARAIADHKARPAKDNPVRHAAEVSALRPRFQNLPEQLAGHEHLRAGGAKTLTVSRLENLPAFMLRALIPQDLPHGQLAETLEAKPHSFQVAVRVGS